MVEKIFFQSSLPRAGSTIFQNIIAQRPDFYASPTSGLLELWFAARANYTESPEFKAQDTELMKKAFLAFCHDGTFGYYNAITDKPYVIDKSRGHGIHYDFLNSFYPKPKIICMVRRIEDILCSMEKKFRANPEKHDPVMNWSKMSGTTTPKRVDNWLSGPPLGLAIERLMEMTRQGIDKNIHFVRYEDLTMYPQTTMTGVYQYLGISGYKHDFDNIEQKTKEDDSVYGIYGDHLIRKEVKPMKSDAERVLGKDVCKWVKENFQWYNQRFDYK